MHFMLSVIYCGVLLLPSIASIAQANWLALTLFVVSASIAIGYPAVSLASILVIGDVR
jgi:hypothetical protein